MPTIVSSKGQSNIEAIKRYFCSEYACQMVAQAAGVDYERMIAGEYKLLIEPIAYFTHNGQYYCMTATEAGLYDQMSGGNLRLLQRVSSGRSAKFTFQPNEFSTYSREVHFTPIWFPDATNYTVFTQVWDTWTPDGMLSINLNDYVSIDGSLYDDWYTNRE